MFAFKCGQWMSKHFEIFLNRWNRFCAKDTKKKLQIISEILYEKLLNKVFGPRNAKQWSQKLDVFSKINLWILCSRFRLEQWHEGKIISFTDKQLIPKSLRWFDTFSFNQWEFEKSSDFWPKKWLKPIKWEIRIRFLWNTHFFYSNFLISLKILKTKSLKIALKCRI